LLSGHRSATVRRCCCLRVSTKRGRRKQRHDESRDSEASCNIIAQNVAALRKSRYDRPNLA
jgi:hypothetical protein